MKEEYIVINKTNLLKRIEELEKVKPDDEKQDFYIKSKIYTLEQVLIDSIPLIPIIEESFDAGENLGRINCIGSSKEDHINQLKLKI